VRAYFFVNSALSGIQKGLQVAHCVAEMSNEDLEDVAVDEKGKFEAWRLDHKTIIVLEGGFHADLHDITGMIRDGDHSFHWDCFSEDEETMNEMMTCVGVILPERIYEAAKRVRETRVNLELGLDDERVWSVVGEFKITEWEAEFIKLLNSCPLAR